MFKTYAILKVHAEETPNPLSLKFITGDARLYPLNQEPSRSFFIKGDPCVISPFARDILSLEGAQGVFFGKGFITITKTTKASWDELKPIIQEKIEQQITDKKEFFIATAPETIETDPKDLGITKQIREVLETRVRPFVQEDGGDIMFHSFQEGIVFVQLLGACNGCPSSFVTLKGGIEKLLKHYVPEVKLVEAINV